MVIPSFHRPGNIRYDTTNKVNDWTRTNLDGGSTSLWATSASRILRPVQADGNDASTFPDLTPNTTTGKINYDVDNDGDGITDSVWLDLGYPPHRDSRGQIYKPLFAFMVIGLNGKIPLNTAGNLAGNASGNGETHAAHLGNSTSEIDPTYALQNGFDGSGLDQQYAFTMPIYGNTNATNPDNSQVDNATLYSAGPPVTITPQPLDVRLIQLRNLLAGTRPQPTPTSTPATGANDSNFVLVGGPLGYYYMPNGIADGSDVPSYDANGNLYVTSTNAPVAGRWGEATSIPGQGYLNINYPASSTNQYVNVLTTSYANPVRAGYSLDISDILGGIPRDAADDNYNSFDFYPTADPAVLTSRRSGEVDDLELYDAAGALRCRSTGSAGS